ncbi:hypothetical protein ACFLSY_10150 [Bacteroidota bacterium]
MNEMQKLRKIFLLKLYEITEGDKWNLTTYIRIANLLQLDEKVARRIADYLHDKGLIEILTLDGSIQITVYGVDEAEEILGDKNTIIESKELREKLAEIEHQLQMLSLGQEVIFNEIDRKFSNVDKISAKDFKSIIISVLLSKGLNAIELAQIFDFIE